MLGFLACLAMAPMTAAAEFAPQRAVWMAWPTYDHKASLPVALVTEAIIRELLPTVKVELLVPDLKVEALVRRRIVSKNLSLRVADYAEIWTRDFGPSFVVGPEGLAIADFGFDYWGYMKPTEPSSVQHERVDRWVAQRLGLPTRRGGMISEGGNRESNGEGIVMLVEAVEKQRNPGLSRAQMTERLKRTLGARTIVWIPQGVVEDGYTFEGPIAGDVYLPITTGGHVDNIARFVSPETVALAEVTAAEAATSPIAAENRRRLEAARQVIEKAGLRVVRMPAPDLVVDTMGPGDPVYDYISTLPYPKGKPFPKGKRVRVAEANSYLNFLISNGVVVSSRFYRPGLPEALRVKDARAAAILRELFPGRRIVQLDTRAVNLGGGGIHCITSHEPLR